MVIQGQEADPSRGVNMEVLVEAGDLLALDLVTKVEGEARVVIWKELWKG